MENKMDFATLYCILHSHCLFGEYGCKPVVWLTNISPVSLTQCYALTSTDICNLHLIKITGKEIHNYIFLSIFCVIPTIPRAQLSICSSQRYDNRYPFTPTALNLKFFAISLNSGSPSPCGSDWRSSVEAAEEIAVNLKVM